MHLSPSELLTIICLTLAFSQQVLSDQREVDGQKPAATDRQGDPLPEGALFRCGSIRLRAAQEIQELAFAPSGKFIVSSGPKWVHLWESATGKLLLKLDVERESARCAAASPDGKLVVTSGGAGLQVWDAETGKLLRRIENRSTHCLVFAHDGRTLAAAADTTIVLLNIVSWEERRLTGHHGAPRLLVFGPDSKTLISTALDGRILHQWDATSGKLLNRNNVPTEKAEMMALSEKGVALAAKVSGSRHLRVWSAQSGKELSRIEIPFGHQPRALALAPDARVVASAGDEGFVYLWDVDTGKQVWRTQERIFSCRLAAFSPDGKTVAVAGHHDAIHLWDATTGKPAVSGATHAGWVDRVAYSPNGKILATACYYDRSIRLWDAATGESLKVLHIPEGTVYSLAFFPDGHTLVAGGDKGSLHYWDVPTGRLTRSLVVRADKVETKDRFIVHAVQPAPDGKTLAVMCQTSSIGEEQRRNATSAFIQLSEVGSGKLLAQHEVPWQFLVGPSAQAIFSQDGQAFVHCGAELSLAQVFTNREMLRLKGAGAGDQPLAFSRDTHLLVTGTARPRNKEGRTVWDSIVRIWDMTTGQEMMALDATGYVETAAFAPDGRILAAASEDGVHLWELAAGEEIGRFHGHGARIRSMVFAPDNKTLACGLVDSTAVVWDMAGAGQRDDKLGRDLDGAELDRLWADLGAANARQAYGAVCKMAKLSRQAVPFLKVRLRPSPGIKPETVEQLVADLDNERFAVRNAAFRELEGHVAEVRPALRRALVDSPSAEVRKKLELLLSRPALPIRSDGLRQEIRGVQVLEYAGTAEARQLLRELACGNPDAHLTQDAKAAIQRLTAPPAAKPRKTNDSRPKEGSTAR
jgi:WD40 repeat protein